MIPAQAVEAVRAIILPYVDDEHFDLNAVSRAALEAAAHHIAADALDAAALDFELSPHNVKAKMARHFNNAYVGKLRERADSLRTAL